MRYIIDGQPVPLARARISGNRCYDSQKQHKLAYGFVLQQQHGKEPVYDFPLHLDATFYFNRPLQQMNRKSSAMKRHKETGSPHFYKPDLDNLIKWILDCGNGILFKDDCLIWSIAAKKIYGEPARTEFELREL